MMEKAALKLQRRALTEKPSIRNCQTGSKKSKGRRQICGRSKKGKIRSEKAACRRHECR